MWTLQLDGQIHQHISMYSHIYSHIGLEILNNLATQVKNPFQSDSLSQKRTKKNGFTSWMTAMCFTVCHFSQINEKDKRESILRKKKKRPPMFER